MEECGHDTGIEAEVESLMPSAFSKTPKTISRGIPGPSWKRTSGRVGIWRGISPGGKSDEHQPRFLNLDGL